MGAVRMTQDSVEISKGMEYTSNSREGPAKIQYRDPKDFMGVTSRIVLQDIKLPSHGNIWNMFTCHPGNGYKIK